jgi:hypothetical protein
MSLLIEKAEDKIRACFGGTRKFGSLSNLVCFLEAVEAAAFWVEAEAETISPLPHHCQHYSKTRSQMHLVMRNIHYMKMMNEEL